MDSAAKIQGRVIYALMMREVHTIYGTTRLGYLWALIQTTWNILIFWAMRQAVGAKAPHGMHILLFLLMGFGIYNMFSGTVSKCMSAVSGNRALLTFPQVTPVDLMVSRTIIAWATEIVAGILLIAVGLLLGMPLYVTDFGALFIVLLVTPLMGLGTGMMFASLTVFYPTLEKIIPMGMRILFFISGLFFSATTLPSYVLKYLQWNPIMQLIELGRTSVSRGYATMPINFTYIFSFTAVTLCLGLLFERHVREKII